MTCFWSACLRRESLPHFRSDPADLTLEHGELGNGTDARTLQQRRLPEAQPCHLLAVEFRTEINKSEDSSGGLTRGGGEKSGGEDTVRGSCGKWQVGGGLFTCRMSSTLASSASASPRQRPAGCEREGMSGGRAGSHARIAERKRRFVCR